MKKTAWSDRIRSLAHRLECQVENIDKPTLRRLKLERKRELSKKTVPMLGEIDMKICLEETVLGEHEDMARALNEYADIRDRLDAPWTARPGSRWFKEEYRK